MRLAPKPWRVAATIFGVCSGKIAVTVVQYPSRACVAVHVGSTEIRQVTCQLRRWYAHHRTRGIIGAGTPRAAVRRIFRSRRCRCILGIWHAASGASICCWVGPGRFPHGQLTGITPAILFQPTIELCGCCNGLWILLSMLTAAPSSENVSAKLDKQEYLIS